VRSRSFLLFERRPESALKKIVGPTRNLLPHAFP
jgi:hypothetical protein